MRHQWTRFSRYHQEQLLFVMSRRLVKYRRETSVRI